MVYLRRAFLLLLMGWLLLPLKARVHASPTVVVVDDNNTDWGFKTEDLSPGSGQYVAGPGTPPAGIGSAELSIPDQGRIGLATQLYNNTYLRDITRLEYSSYRSTADPNNILSIALQIGIDYDLDDNDTSWQGRLVYEPYKQGYSVPQNTWQSWDALQGKWWATQPPNNTLCTRDNPCTLSELVAQYPNAGIVGALFFKAGGKWPEFRGNVDQFIIGVQGQGEVLYDFEPAAAKIASTQPLHLNNGLTLSEGAVLPYSFSQMLIQVSEPLYDPPGDFDPKDVTNPRNYELRRNDGLVIPLQITYDDHGGSGPYEIHAILNNGRDIPNGHYTFVIHGDSSVVNLNHIPIAGDGVHPGTNFVLHFTVAAPERLPDTGFPMGKQTHLPTPPEARGYAATALTIEIPRLGVRAPILGVPASADGWDVAWLGQAVGWLEGTAFPTWQGNTVLTGHVWNADNTPGVFFGLHRLRYGDRVVLHAWGHRYIYQVRANRRLHPEETAAALTHSEHDILTLLTCEGYQTQTETYRFRRMVRAVLVAVEANTSPLPPWHPFVAPALQRR